MSAPPREEQLSLAAGRQARLLVQGEGAPLVFLGGLRGLPRWPAFLAALAKSHRVIAPALPGFHGHEKFRDLDHIIDWVSATLDLLDACAPGEHDLVGASLGGTLAAEVAAFAQARVRRLCLIAPLGVFRNDEPVADIWAQRRSRVAPLLSERPEALEAFLARPDDVDETEWTILSARSQEASARLLWPNCDTGLARRLHRIHCPTLLLWGDADHVVPPSYAKYFSQSIAGPVTIHGVAGAGHMAEIDQPEAVAEAILNFLD